MAIGCGYQTLDRPLKIDIAVHGRFHAFHLARALLARGHDVRLLTNYPTIVVKRFGFPRSRSVTCVAHGIAAKMCGRLPHFLRLYLEPSLSQWFGRWVCSTVRDTADVIYIFSGVAEETLRSRRAADKPQIWVVRGSSHIRLQERLLREEEARTGVRLEKPSSWMISREEREYEKAQRVITLSSYARNSFGGQSVTPEKVSLLLSAVDIARFRPDQETTQARLERISSGQPLRVLTVGTFSMRKGVYDLIEIAKAMKHKVSFRFVGDVSQEALDLKRSAASAIEFVDRVPEFKLMEHYAWGDLFVFPTIEDGFPAVLAQALAAGLPALATPNSSAPDIVRDGETGWILPIRSASTFIKQLKWCDTHRIELQKMVEKLCFEFTPRDWNDMASDFESVYLQGT